MFEGAKRQAGDHDNVSMCAAKMWHIQPKGKLSLKQSGSNYCRCSKSCWVFLKTYRSHTRKHFAAKGFPVTQIWQPRTDPRKSFLGGWPNLDHANSLSRTDSVKKKILKQQPATYSLRICSQNYNKSTKTWHTAFCEQSSREDPSFSGLL